MRLESLLAAWVGGGVSALVLWRLMARGSRQWMLHPIVALLLVLVGTVTSDVWATRFPGPGTLGQVIGWSAAVVAAWVFGLAIDGWRSGLVWAWAVGRPPLTQDDLALLRGHHLWALTPALPPLLLLAGLLWRGASAEACVMWPLLTFLFLSSLGRVALIIGLQQRASGRALTDAAMSPRLWSRALFGVVAETAPPPAAPRRVR